MVVPSSAPAPATTVRRRRRPARKRAHALLTCAVVIAIALGVALPITLSLLSPGDDPVRTRRGALEAEAEVRPAKAEDAGGDADDGTADVPEAVASKASGRDAAETRRVPVPHVSAKHMLHSPHVMYGTAWKKDATAELVTQAIHAGFRFIDTACQPKHYNEAGVGEGWTLAADQLGLRRDDFFLQTKFTDVSGQDPNDMPYDAKAELEDQVRQSIETSLKNLQTDYIDAVLLHSPLNTMDETLRAWKVLEEYVVAGKIKQLGISNCYGLKKFLTLHTQATIKPTVLQNRFYRDSKFDVELRLLCKALGIQYQAFWTLSANQKAISSPEWETLSQREGLTPQTLMYAFMMNLGHVPLSGTTDTGHMEEDIDIMFRLERGETIFSDYEISLLSRLLGIE